MGHINEGGNYVDPDGGLYVSGAIPMQTGEIKTHMTQSQAGLGAQGQIQPERRFEPIPEPTHPDMPDA